MAAKKKTTKRTPKTAARAPSKRQQVLAVMNQINRAAKKPVIRFAEDSPNRFYLRRPTGIAQLDVDLAGGFPAASLCTITGPNGGGKTTLLYRLFAEQQRLFGQNSVIAFASPESPIDFWWARKNGWIIAIPDEIINAEQEARKLQGIPTLTKQDIADLKFEIGTNIRVEGDDGESILNNIEKLVETGACNIIALDSIESIMPSSEAGIEDLHDHPQQASRASILTRFMQRWGPTMNSVSENLTTLMFTCQVRANRKKSEAPAYRAKYMRDWDSTAPNAIKHWRAIDLLMIPGEKIKGTKDKVKFNKGKMLKWETGKGRAGTHEGITGEIAFEYDGLIDTIAATLLTGMKYGVIEETDGLFTLHREMGEDPHWRKLPRDEFIDRLERDVENELLVRREILSAAGHRCLYR